MINISGCQSISPYKGLVSYSEVDRLFFFGRKKDQEIIINNLTTWRLTVLYGPSGVGKSSILRAGVAGYLRQTAQENVDIGGKPRWAVIVFPSIQGKLAGKISWRDPLNGIIEQLQEEIKI